VAEVTPPRFVPEIVTVVPPTSDPVAGLRPETVVGWGAGAESAGAEPDPVDPVLPAAHAERKPTPPTAARAKRERRLKRFEADMVPPGSD
jgi:hypothetical protein